jgi:tetratricopeptide (TPR) repeat protein
LILALARLAAAQPSGAGPPVKVAGDVAREHFELGRRHHELGNYLQAVEEFKLAYLAEPIPLFLFNIGQAYRRAGRTDEALEFYQRFLELSPRAPERAEVSRIIAALEAQRQSSSMPPTKPTAPEPTSPAEPRPMPPTALAPGSRVSAPTGSATAPRAPHRDHRRRVALAVGLSVGAVIVGGAVAAIAATQGGREVTAPPADLGSYRVFR